MPVQRAAEYWNLGLDFLDGGNYIAVNRSLVKAFGLNVAVMIGELASEAKYWKRNGMLQDGWFFSTVENMEDATGLNAYYQREALRKMQELGFVEVKYMGLPRKRYFRINGMEIVMTIAQIDEETAGSAQCFTECTTDGALSERLDVHPVNDNNNNKQPQINNSDISDGVFRSNAASEERTRRQIGVRRNTPRDARGFKPIVPYPRCVEEVVDYIESEDDDVLDYAAEHKSIITAFIGKNEGTEWRMDDGSPIMDWRSVFRLYCAHCVANAIAHGYKNDFLADDGDVHRTLVRLQSRQNA